MKISDITCPACQASYEVAESISARGNPGCAKCKACGALMESWQEPKLRAYRLVLPPMTDRPHAAAPASPSR